MRGLGHSIAKGYENPHPNEHNATVQNTNSFEFDGSGDSLELADNDDFSFSQEQNGYPDSPFSFAVWINRDSVSSNHALVCKASGSDYEYRIFFIGDDLYMDHYDTTSGNYARRFKTNISIINTWEHYTITFSGDTAGFKLYKNGVDLGLLSSGSGGSEPKGDMENLGAKFQVGECTGLSDFDGHMCQLILWSKELAAYEVEYIYGGGTVARDPRTETYSYNAADSLVGWWPLDDANGHVDHGSNGHDFTKVGNAGLSSSANTPF